MDSCKHQLKFKAQNELGLWFNCTKCKTTKLITGALMNVTTKQIKSMLGAAGRKQAKQMLNDRWNNQLGKEFTQMVIGIVRELTLQPVEFNSNTANAVASWIDR